MFDIGAREHEIEKIAKLQHENRMMRVRHQTKKEINQEVNRMAAHMRDRERKMQEEIQDQRSTLARRENKLRRRREFVKLAELQNTGLTTQVRDVLSSDEAGEKILGVLELVLQGKRRHDLAQKCRSYVSGIEKHRVSITELEKAKREINEAHTQLKIRIGYLKRQYVTAVRRVGELLAENEALELVVDTLGEEEVRRQVEEKNLIDFHTTNDLLLGQAPQGLTEKTTSNNDLVASGSTTGGLQGGEDTKTNNNIFVEQTERRIENEQFLRDGKHQMKTTDEADTDFRGFFFPEKLEHEDHRDNQGGFDHVHTPVAQKIFVEGTHHSNGDSVSKKGSRLNNFNLDEDVKPPPNKISTATDAVTGEKTTRFKNHNVDLNVTAFSMEMLELKLADQLRKEILEYRTLLRRYREMSPLKHKQALLGKNSDFQNTKSIPQVKRYLSEQRELRRELRTIERDEMTKYQFYEEVAEDYRREAKKAEHVEVEY